MKKIIIVPSWMQRVLIREKLSTKEILSYTKLKAYFCFDDIKALVLLQSYNPFKAYHIDEDDGSALLQAWKRNNPGEDFSVFNSLVNSSSSNNIDKDHLKFLISGEHREAEQDKGYEIMAGDYHNLLLVLKDGYFGSEDYEQQDTNIVENILRVLYGEFMQEEIARTPIFKRYVVLLSNVVTR